jgi:signal transduction histidine kinase
MLAVLNCVKDGHDPRLLLIALVICVGSSLTAFGVYDRALKATGRFRRGWLILAGMIAGSGVWATHFLAMLAYQPTLAIGYDLVGTGLSLGVAIGGMTLAFALPVVVSGRRAFAAAGLIAGLGVAAMHTLGMAALRMTAIMVVDHAIAATGLAIGMSLSVLALLAFARRPSLAMRGLAGLLFVLSILSLHFIAMSAITLVPDSLAAPSPSILDRGDLAIVTTLLAAGLLLACLGLLCVESQSHRSTLESLRSSLDALPIGMALFDPSGRLVVWNIAFADLLVVRGMAPDVASGQQALLDACHGDGAGADQAWPDGRWIRVESGPTPDGGGAIVLTDQTQERKTAEAMAEALDQAQAANRAKSEFLANMSHEIRTPLNGIIGAADLLTREPLPGHQAELVQMIHASGHTLNRLVSDIIDLARVEAGKLDVSAEPFDLAETVNAAANLFRLRAEEKGVCFEVDIDPDAAGLVIGDPVRLRQILGNLISNAIKFTDRGAVTVSVVRPAGDEGVCLFRIADTGIGFAPEAGARLFDRFEQADPAIARRYGGSGLGLAICRDLTRLLGGVLTCESTVGQGSTFCLTLPLPVADGVDAGATSGPATLGPADALKVLVVDDHPNNRRFLEILLAHAGVETVSANDGQAAVDAWQSGPFDAILMGR